MDIRYWILSLTTRCNLHCAYCYAASVAQGTDMSKAVLDAALDRIRRGSGPVHVQLTGGEPTLVPGLLKKAVRVLGSLQRPCTVGVQTNGTVLTPDLARLFKDLDVQVGVSLDGPPAVQESLRGLASQTLRGLQLLEALHVPFRVTTVVCRQNVLCLDRLVWMLAGFKMARGIGLDLLVEKGRARKNGSVCPAGEAELKTGLGSMMRALQAANQRRSPPLSLRELELLRSRREKGGSSLFCHAMEGKSAAVHPDGGLFPCGQTMGDAAFRAGSIQGPEPEKFKGFPPNGLSRDQCLVCPLQAFCPGDCPSRLHYNAQQSQNGPPLACVMYQTLWRTAFSNANSTNPRP